MDTVYWYAGTCICIACIILGTVGNGMTIYIISKLPHLRDPIGCFILSLAIADFICSTVVIPYNVTFFINEGKWKFNKALCIIQKSLGFGNSAFSAILVFFIAVNRYFKICHSVKVYDRIYTNVNILVMIFISWLYSHLGFLLLSFDYGAKLQFDEVQEICSLEFTTLFPWIYTVGTYFLMVVGLVFSYGNIYCSVAKSRRIVAQHQSAIVQLRREKINTKLMKMLLASTFSYLACVLVPLIAGIVGDSDGDFRETAGEMFFTYIPAWIGVILNPIIYGITNLEYRKAYLKIIPCI